MINKLKNELKYFVVYQNIILFIYRNELLVYVTTLLTFEDYVQEIKYFKRILLWYYITYGPSH